MTAPLINPYTFPYRRKWSKSQVQELIERSERLKDLMTDAVGPSGQPMWIPPDLVALMSVHLALAGADTHDDERQFIVWRLAELREDEVQFEDQREWLLREDYTDEMAEQDQAEAERMRQARADLAARKLTPQMRKQLAAELIGGMQLEDEARKDDR